MTMKLLNLQRIRSQLGSRQTLKKFVESNELDEIIFEKAKESCNKNCFTSFQNWFQMETLQMSLCP